MRALGADADTDELKRGAHEVLARPRAELAPVRLGRLQPVDDERGESLGQARRYRRDGVLGREATGPLSANSSARSSAGLVVCRPFAVRGEVRALRPR